MLFPGCSSPAGAGSGCPSPGLGATAGCGPAGASTGSAGLVHPCLISGVCLRKNSPTISIDDLAFADVDLEESDSSEVQAMNQVRQQIVHCFDFLVFSLKVGKTFSNNVPVYVQVNEALSGEVSQIIADEPSSTSSSSEMSVLESGGAPGSGGGGSGAREDEAESAGTEPAPLTVESTAAAEEFVPYLLVHSIVSSARGSGHSGNRCVVQKRISSTGCPVVEPED